MPTIDLYEMSLPGPMLQRGFWLYVWQAIGPWGQMLYVGRTGDNSSPHATAPYTRMGQHLGFAKNQNALRRHLHQRDLIPEEGSSFDLIAHGPIYPEIAKDDTERGARMKLHTPYRNRVGAMEKLLHDDLKSAGYDVMNTVNCHFVLDGEGLEKWQIARAAFASAFPKLIGP